MSHPTRWPGFGEMRSGCGRLGKLPSDQVILVGIWGGRTGVRRGVWQGICRGAVFRVRRVGDLALLVVQWVLILQEWRCY